MDSPILAILGKFDKPKKTGDQWLVRCPAHADKKASLAIMEGDEGRVLLHCHAGCQLAAILTALGLTDADLFPSKEAPSTITATYDYQNEQGQLLYQVVRYEPKSFRQRRPDGTGGWIWKLDGVPRVLYRSLELSKRATREAIILVEGEKDADAAWARGLPATTSAGGAGKWLESYTEQLRRWGVKRVAIIPDNDVPGRAHATDVATQLAGAGLEPRVVVLPDLVPKGDLSDFFALGRTAGDLLELIRGTAAWKESSAPSSPVALKQFERLDDGHYRWSVVPPGIAFEIDHLQRHHSDLTGELAVFCDLAGSRKSDNGTLLSGQCNLMALATRKSWAKELQERSNTTREDIDWFDFLENFCNLVREADKQGEPVLPLTGVRRSRTQEAWWTIEHLTLHRRLPSCIFGWSGIGKSYIALYVAGCLARQGVPVIYLDGELDHIEHDERCAQMFGEAQVRNLSYLRLRDLASQRDYVKDAIRHSGAQYLVLDSITKLAGGKLEDSDTAKSYINSLDSLGVGSLNIAHITKSAQQGDIRPQDQHVYGASQWEHMLRHCWFVKGDGRDAAEAGGSILGFYLTKSNLARPGQSIGWRFELSPETVRFSHTDLVDSPELSKHESLKVRLIQILANGRLLSYEDAATELNVKPDSVRKAVQRNVRVFRKVENVEGHVLVGAVV